MKAVYVTKVGERMFASSPGSPDSPGNPETDLGVLKGSGVGEDLSTRPVEHEGDDPRRETRQGHELPHPFQRELH